MRAVWGAAAAAAAGAAYAFYEPYRFRFVEHTVPVASRSGATILHVSDTHMSARDSRMAAFVRSTTERVVPDFVIATGDMIQDGGGVEPLVETLSAVEARVARYYVLGSHDYFTATLPNYAKYFTGNRDAIRPVPNDSEGLEEGLQEKGWIPLANAERIVDVDGYRIRFTGLDDPYLHRHRTNHIGRRRDDELAIGVMHAPDVVSEFALSGYDLVLAGHTHGGQVRLPGVGALVTNCSLPAGLAGGLHRVGATWLHVSPGLGAGRFTPIRFNCRPEITLLELRPR